MFIIAHLILSQIMACISYFAVTFTIFIRVGIIYSQYLRMNMIVSHIYVTVALYVVCATRHTR